MFRYQKTKFDTGATVSVQYALFSFQNPKTVSVRSCRTGTVCLNQIPEAKYRIGTSQAYRYGQAVPVPVDDEYDGQVYGSWMDKENAMC
ncbi:hypothetical protein V6N13_012108 [Hibiscus sabdariffa]